MDSNNTGAFDNKFNLNNLENNVQTFEEESNEYDGGDVAVRIIKKI
jgi:hypothetical protein